MTILEALSWGQAQIKETENEKPKGRHNAKLDAQILLSHILEKPTSFIFAHIDEILTDKQIDKYQRLVARRRRHEPVAYILGEQEFYSRSFIVNQNVLVPRPDTELMIDEALARRQEDPVILDIGTGSGAIAVTLSKELDTELIAIDIDPDALAVAKQNAKKHGVQNKISFMQGNLLEPYLKKQIDLSRGDNYVLILANLPYLTIASWGTLDPDVRNYEPKRALIAGVDGLDFYDELLSQIKSKRNLFPKKTEIMMEIDPHQELTLPRLIKEHFEGAVVTLKNDLANRPRLVIAKI
ncbi:peptide chain release factor N(5)-glutamine methyltransferase [Candidatus Uhrbacteria bacterium CG_4_10_14_0_2_um_filter_41_7]|uniref:Release factor glutamine methyltransferase n=1 Tax=Candidatus Uhrbacteria bacterium CG_4_9_14_3_um_filter_41_35 TaxID=1975034 RepID=A0A2M7XFW8_9BACT|nr:MAG: protein-(glutamine-N5) methyltransferase, release factor-specific [Candidatus Uhrbacteria bacterium CG11_big_fil_rev_8_21_14_0_20_41_9]PIZ55694.1 MAG: peptide chain release factor N(5)-glutamine methyltransferase [Candidatus Uhrbacteria bacterium CG_4_10_14_0_2_um_filter_41_7]PJA46767.1 MAG: peptide chain release factor N(5)-glutamine methyltransferase [Candidatus Uhrbacteria bacterium CG_4_9_14_3_um_filter_41_35]